MSPPDRDRLRTHPAERFAGPEQIVDLATEAAQLRREPIPAKHGHRQITLVHKGPLRVMLFAFEPGGRLPGHTAPGVVVLQALTGSLTVRTPDATHGLHTGRILALEPAVPHDVEALGPAELLVTVLQAS